MVTAHWRITFSDEASGGSGAIQVTPDALRGQGQRSKRILDLVSDAARHLAPGGLLLGTQNIGEVLQHDDVSGTLPAVARRLQRADRGKPR